MLQQKKFLMVIAVLVLTNIAVLILYVNNSEQPSSYNIINYHPVMPSKCTNDSASFTVDDHLYIYYGEGRSDVTETSLLRYINAQISRPSQSRPRALEDKTGRKHFSQIGQSELVDHLLKQRRNGFFVECGAFDGEHLSNSLFFELERNWTGLLIEANPYSHRALLKKNRNAFALNACLSTKPTPGRLSFRPANVLGGLVENLNAGQHSEIAKYKLAEGDNIQVECFPLNSIMASLGINHIDYFSLDVEGAELGILQNIDWNTLRIDILSIECPTHRAADRKEIENIFKSLSFYKEVVGLNQDMIYERI